MDKIYKDTLEIPLELGLKKRAGYHGWFFGRTVNAYYIDFFDLGQDPDHKS